MKREFRKGDVLVRIDMMDKMWVYGVNGGRYYVMNLNTGIAEVWTSDIESRFVKVDRMDEKAVNELARELKIVRNSKYGIGI